MNFDEYWQSAWNPSDNMPGVLSMAFREIAEKAWNAATEEAWNEAIKVGKESETRQAMQDLADIGQELNI